MSAFDNRKMKFQKIFYLITFFNAGIISAT
jgi:hypothetical protein